MFSLSMCVSMYLCIYIYMCIFFSTIHLFYLPFGLSMLYLLLSLLISLSIYIFVFPVLPPPFFSFSITAANVSSLCYILVSIHLDGFLSFLVLFILFSCGAIVFFLLLMVSTHYSTKQDPHSSILLVCIFRISPGT